MATDAELRDQAVAELQLTTESYPQWVAASQPPGRWKNAFTILAQISAPPVPPPPPPPTQFGTLLPARMGESAGSVINCAGMTAAQVQTQLDTCAFGSILDLGGTTKDVGGAINLTWSRNGNGVVTTLRNGVLDNTRLLVTGAGSYFRARNVTIDDAPYQSFKVEGTTAGTVHHIELDGCLVRRAKNMAPGSQDGDLLYVGRSSGNVPYNIQFWNVRGEDSMYVNPVYNFGHAVYWAQFGADCVMANCLFTRINGFGLHVYPGPGSGLIFTGITLVDVGRSAIIVMGSTDFTNIKFVGIIAEDSTDGIAYCYDALAANNRLYGAVQWPSGGNHQLANLAATAYVVADPLLDSSYRPALSSPAASIVPLSMQGYLPALDIAGQARVSRDAGCYRVGTAAPPPPPPPPTGAYGASLPARLPETTRAVTTVTTLAALKTAVAAGGDIRISGTINVGSEINLILSTPGTAGNPNMISGGKLIGRIWIKSQYWRIRGVEITGTPYEGILIARGAPASFIDIDNCWIHHVGSHGIVTDGVATDIQVWNCLIEQCGQSGPTSAWSYDCISARGTTSRITIGSNLIRPRNGMGVSLYPNPAGVTCVANTIIGGISRGGYAIQGGTNVKIVGDIITGSPTGAFAITSISAPTTTIQDCIQYGNTQGAWATGFAQAATVANLQNVNPLHTADGHLGAGSPAIGYVQAARHPFLPAEDRDGDVRVTADCGCFSA